MPFANQTAFRSRGNPFTTRSSGDLFPGSRSDHWENARVIRGGGLESHAQGPARRGVLDTRGSLTSARRRQKQSERPRAPSSRPNTRPTSIPSNRFWPSSQPCCARRAPEASKPSSTSSPKSWSNTPRTGRLSPSNSDKARIPPVARISGAEHKHLTHTETYATYREFTDAALRLVHEQVSGRWPEFRDSGADNFRVNDPNNFRILA